jgi:hypothetical protein
LLAIQTSFPHLWLLDLAIGSVALLVVYLESYIKIRLAAKRRRNQLI